MAWFQVDDQLAMHRKVCDAGNAAMGLWVRSGAWSMQNLTEGFVPTSAAKTLGTKAQAAALVKAGLWTEADGGYQFHEWGTRQMSAEQIADRRRKRAEAGRKGGQGKKPPTGEAKPKANHQANASASAKPEPEQNRTPVPVPVPNDSGYVDSSRPVTNARAPMGITELATGRPERRPEPPPADPGSLSIAATEAADLVAEVIPPGRYPADVETALRRHVAAMLAQLHPPDRAVILEALRLWDGRDGGPGLLPHLLADATKSLRPNPTPPRASPSGTSTADAKVADWLALAQQQPDPKAIES